MKVKIGRDVLVKNLKLIKQLGSIGAKGYGETIGLNAEENSLAVFLWISNAFIYINLEAEVEESGRCYVNHKLYDIVKLIKDQQISLKLNQSLSVTSGKFKATLANMESPKNDLNLFVETAKGNTSNVVTLFAQEMQHLTEVSKAFAPIGKDYLYVQVSVNQHECMGTVQPSEEGQLEAYPLAGVMEGLEVYKYRLLTDYVRVALNFSESYIRLETPERFPGTCKISDPENDSWFMICTQIQTGKEE